MYRYRFARHATALALPALGMIAGCGNGVPSTLKIGVAEPLSGPSASRGQDVLNGMQLAAKELNAAGYKVDGKPVTIEILPVDDKADPETAKKVGQDLVTMKVAAVVGDLSSDVTAATLPVYKNGDVPQLFTSTATELTKAGDGNAFRLVANDELQGKAIVGYLDDTLKAQNAALIYENTAFGEPIAKTVGDGVQHLGKSIKASDAVDKQTTDFSAFVAKLKASPPDVLVAVLRDSQLLPLFEQLQAAQLQNLPVIVAGAGKTDKLLHSPSDIKSLYVTSSIVDPGNTDSGKVFLKKFIAAYNAEPVWAAHYGYDAVYILADVVQHTRSVDPKAVREMLRTLDTNAPVNGTMRFGDNGEQRYGAITVYQRIAGQWEPLMRSDKW